MQDFNTQELGMNLDAEVFGEENQKTSAFDKIKPHIGTIIKIIILLGILFLSYYFFFMRYTYVTFEVQNLSKGLNGNMETTTITLEKEGKQNNYNTGESIKILPGDYTVSINDPELNNLFLANDKLSITKDDEGTTKTIILYPDWTSKLKAARIEGPSTIYEGQKVDLKFTINNTGKPINITLKGDGDFNNVIEDWDLGTGTKTKIISYINKRKADKAQKTLGSLYIEKTGDKFKKSFSAKIKKAPQIKLNTPASYSVKAGQDLKIIFELNNPTNTPVDSLQLELSNANIDSDILKSWIQTQSKDINLGLGKTSTYITLRIPLNQSGNDITFDAIFKNSYVNVKKSVTLKIAQADIIIPKNLDFGLVTAGTGIKQKTILIENNTEFSITLKKDFDPATNVNITSPADPQNKVSDLLQIFSVDIPDKIEPKAKVEIPITLIIPPNFESDALKGTITINTGGSEDSKNDFVIPFTLNIVGISLKLELQSLQSEYKFTFDEVSQQSEKKLFPLTLKNSGNVDLNIMDIKINNCSDFGDKEQITVPLTIKKGESQGFFLVLKKIYKTNLTEPKSCSFDISYQDPTIPNAVSFSTKTYPFSISP